MRMCDTLHIYIYNDSHDAFIYVCVIHLFKHIYVRIIYIYILYIMITLMKFFKQFKNNYQYMAILKQSIR